jgi:hypothetical protein
MVNYKLQAIDNDIFHVVEVTTDQVIKDKINHREAKALCRHLNFGGGFDGNTPGFFLNKLEKFHFEDDYFYK